MHQLTIEQQQYLASKGFAIDSKQSDYYSIEIDNQNISLIPNVDIHNDESFKLEISEILTDGDSDTYEDFIKVFSKPGQTLQEFIDTFMLQYKTV